jgi:hypothetical protein
MDLLNGYGSSSDEEEAGSATAAQVAENDSKVTSSTRTQPETLTTKSQRKGRKILSLAAVLPQHILDQLTKSQVQGDGDNSSDEEDEKRAATAKASTHSGARDQGISSFLSDLSAVRPSTGSVATGSKKKKSAPQRERMGAAFLQKSSVVVETENEVRDIHRKKEESYVEEPSMEQEPSTEQEPSMEQEPSSTAPPSTKPAASSFRRAAAPSVRTKNPAPVVTAAPVAPSQFSQPQHDEQPPPDDRATCKRSRREMERALRRGDFSVALQGNEHVASVAQAQPDAYTPEPETYAIPQHGIKVVPTAMYDPSAGQATAAAPGASKGRGKNQIHHLMASAATLELQRARGLGPSGASAGKVHRANAKHKYGW